MMKPEFLQPKEALRSRGQVLLGFVLLFMAATLVLVFGANAEMFSQIQKVRSETHSFHSYVGAESASEDVAYRIIKGMNVSPTETLVLNAATATATKYEDTDQVRVVGEGDKNNLIRTTELILKEGSGVSFNYGVQAGEGGFDLQNSSKIEGNAYSNGPVKGEDNYVLGTVVSAGPDGLIEGIHATSSAYANTIQDSIVDKDAYYKNISNTTVKGTKYPDSENQPTSTLPISDEKIENWQKTAKDGGLIGSPCPYEITSDTTIGPKKIMCDLVIRGNNMTVSLTGPVWVEGDVTIKNGPTVRVDKSLDEKSVPIIADNETAPESSGIISLENKTQFKGSGEDGTYVLLLSENTSADNGGSTKAITIKNSAKGDVLLYAAHGEVELRNSVSLREVGAHTVTAKNTATVVYESGLANLLFDSGPSGGFEVTSWKEVE